MGSEKYKLIIDWQALKNICLLIINPGLFMTCSIVFIRFSRAWYLMKAGWRLL